MPEALIDENGNYKKSATLAEIAVCWAKEGTATAEHIANELVIRVLAREFAFYRFSYFTSLDHVKTKASYDELDTESSYWSDTSDLTVSVDNYRRWKLS